MPRVDYDRIAHLYDEPMRRHSVDERLIAYLESRPDLDPAMLHVLDIGCGTGTQLAANRSQWPFATFVGVDRFRGMLRVAGRNGPGISWVQGDGARIPLASDSFHYATNQFSYHHIHNRSAFVHEMYRVLCPGGRFVMVNIDPWSMPNWAIYQYFPETLQQDQADFLTSASFESEMRAAGFADIVVERRTIRRERPLAEFLAYASERHRTSQFITISDAAYEAGLARIRAAVASAGDEPAPVELGVCLLIITGHRPTNS
jgi:SAM-dependent methyltransferase